MNSFNIVSDKELRPSLSTIAYYSKLLSLHSLCSLSSLTSASSTANLVSVFEQHSEGSIDYTEMILLRDYFETEFDRLEAVKSNGIFFIFTI